ncbi:MAG: AbrB/MazE/SpoVT family DNA-binding domain-containing protein [Candidatus Micrarchaeota archaeon]
MEHAVVVSPKFQIVVPKWVRQLLCIEKGQKLEVFVEDNKVSLVPVPKLESLFGKYPDLRKGPSMKKIRQSWGFHV